MAIHIAIPYTSSLSKLILKKALKSNFYDQLYKNGILNNNKFTFN